MTAEVHCISDKTVSAEAVVTGDFDMVNMRSRLRKHGWETRDMKFWWRHGKTVDIFDGYVVLTVGSNDCPWDWKPSLNSLVNHFLEAVCPNPEVRQA